MNNYLELRQVISVLFRRWWVLVLGSLIGALIGFGISQSQPWVYEANATVMVGESIQPSDLSRDDIAARDVAAQTYVALANRQPVLAAVIKTLGLDVSLDEMKDRTRIRTVDAHFIRITVQANNPREAQLIAGEIAHQLILLSPDPEDKDSTQLFLQQEIEDLQTRIESGRKELLTLQARSTSGMTADQRDARKIEIAALERLLTDWENTYARLLGLLNPNAFQNRLILIEEAQANREPLSPRLSLNIWLGVGLGFVLALGIIYLIDQFDDKVRSAEILERKLGLRHLGSVSKMKGINYDGILISAQDPLSNLSESYRMIIRNIEFITKDQPVESLLVTSPGADEGKSITVSNLGITLAQAGFKTIIVDADLRESVQHLIFDIPNGIGLSDLLTTLDLKPKEQLIDTGIANLQLLASGNLPHNPVALLRPKRMKQILSDLIKFSDVVILDVPSMTSAESAELSSLVGGVILVIDFGRTTQASVGQSVAKLHPSSRLLGGILNRSDP